MDSINWYLTKTNNAIEKISKIFIPADGKELRFQYSSLIESLFSTVDYMIDNNKFFSRDKNYIHTEIAGKLGTEGKEILPYMRELRNSVVHRGLDISARGDVIKGRIALHAPTGITDQWGKAKTNPSESILDFLLCDLDRVIKELVNDELTRVGFLTKDDSQAITSIAQGIKTLELPNNVPEYAKALFAKYQSSLDMHTANQHAACIYNASIDNLKENLSITMDIRYLT